MKIPAGQDESHSIMKNEARIPAGLVHVTN